MIDILRMQAATDNLYCIVKDFDEVAFGAIIATTIDQWAVDHDYDVTKACKITENILKAQPGAWETLGPPAKTKGE